MDPGHEALWQHAAPLLGVRSNDIHTQYLLSIRPGIVCVPSTG